MSNNANADVFPARDNRRNTPRSRGRRPVPAATSNRVPPPEHNPVPAHLSTTATIPRNEPFIIDEFLHDLVDTQPIMPEPTLTNDFAGYMDLVDSVYMALLAKDRYLPQTLPRSMFVYYCVEVLWHRLNYLEMCFSRTQHNIDFQRLMDQLVLVLPEPIVHYLNGIGEFTDTTGVTYRVRSSAWPSPTGDFGLMNGGTSGLYQTCPAPLVTVQRLAADITTPHVPQWNLAGALVPNDTPAGQTAVPNPNLLGYDVSIAQGPRELGTWTALGFTPGANPVVPQSQTAFLLIPTLMSYVSGCLANKGTLYKMKTFQNSSSNGSPAQGINMNPTSAQFLMRGSKFTLGGFETMSHLRPGPLLTTMAHAMQYRLYRSTGQGQMPRYTAFTFSNALGVEVVPPAQYTALANRDVAILMGTTLSINTANHRSVTRERGPMLQTISSSFSI